LERIDAMATIAAIRASLGTIVNRVSG